MPEWKEGANNPRRQGVNKSPDATGWTLLAWRGVCASSPRFIPVVLCLERLEVIYSEYGIVINKKKTKIVDLKHGFTFLKTHFYITETGRIIKKPCRDSITRERRKLKKQADLVASGVLTFDEVRHSYASWRGSMSHRDAYRTVQSMDRLFNRLFIDQWKGGPQP